MEPGMEIREEHKNESRQRDAHEQALQRYKERKGKKNRNKSGILLAVWFLTVLVSAVVITVFVMLLRDAKKEKVEAEAALAQLREQDSEKYTQAMVDQMLADVMENSAEEQRRQIKEDLRQALEEPGAGMTTTLREFYSDYVFYQIPGGYRFVPVDESYPKNELVRDRLQKDSNGWYQYVVDGEVKSVPMIDVSQFQEEIDWQAVADAGIKHAMLRVGYRGYGSGKLMIDECFEANVQGALEAGIEVGVYFFTQAISEEEAHEEAALVIEQLEPYEIKLPVAIDVERITTDSARADALDAAARTRYVRTFLEDIREAGYTPMIYGGVYSFFEMLDPAQIQEYPVWYAFYDNYIYYPYPVQGWQYSEKATIPGVKGTADLNLWVPLEQE